MTFNCCHHPSHFGTQENNICNCFHFSPIYLPWSDGLDAMILVFRTLSFKPAFLLSSFTLKRLFSFYSLSAIRVVLSAYLRLLILLLATLILACASCCLAFCMMYSAYKFVFFFKHIVYWQIKYTHIIVQPSPLLIPRTFSLQTFWIKWFFVGAEVGCLSYM